MLVLRAAGGEAVREIGAAELLAGRAVADRMIDPLQVSASPVLAAFDDAFGDFADAGVEVEAMGEPFATAKRLMS